MDWLQNLDISLFRFLNGRLVNPLFDQVMPFLSGNALFFPALILLAPIVIWKTGKRGLVFFLLIALIVASADGLICRTIKKAIGRDRPFVTLTETRVLLGKGRSGSMPSSHAANWFAATMVAYVFFRRSVWIMLPLACGVSFSRVYCGVHYSSDVAAGAILGAGHAAASLWLLNGLWVWLGRKWFPLWWEKYPSLLAPPPKQDLEAEEAPRFAPRRRPGETPPQPDLFPHATPDQQWLRLGYLVIAILLAARLGYIASRVIELSPDEASLWLRSKHLTASFSNGPPLAMLAEFAGTRLWGDSGFGARFFAPILSALMSLAVLRFFGKYVNARAGFFLVLIITATPMLSAGAIVLKGDFLLCFFWTLAMIAGWRAVQADATARAWFWVGLWTSLAIASSYAGGLLLVCWLLFFILWPSARKHLRRPGPYLALAVIFICVFPLLERNPETAFTALDTMLSGSHIHLTRNFLRQIAFRNPFFLAAALWAAVAFWRRSRHNPLLVYCFCMGVPSYLIILGWSLRSTDSWSWTAAALVPLLCLMTIYWDTQWRLGSSRLKPWLVAGVVLGLAAVLVGHETNWFSKIGGRNLPLELDPMAGVRGWSDSARLANDSRMELETESKPVFVIAGDEGLAGEISFYLPAAKAVVKEDPLIYFRNSGHHGDWEPYSSRKGQNAIFVRELPRHDATPGPAPAFLQEEFDSVQDLGVKSVRYHGQILRSLQIFACRNLK